MGIPAGFRYLRTDRYEQADAGPAPRSTRTAERAVYAEADGVEFVLVPGTEHAVLGWSGGLARLDSRTRASVLIDLERVLDPATGYARWRAETDPAAEPEAAAWLDREIEAARAAGPPDLPQDVRHRCTPEGYSRYLDESMSTPRTATIPTLLVERVPQILGWEAAGLYNVATDEARLGPGGETIVAAARDGLRATDADELQIWGLGRFHRGEDGWWRIERQVPTTHADLVAQFAPFRLPTEDEWEYLADAAGGTLFRWGDTLPDDVSQYGYWASQNVLDTANLNGLMIARDQFVMEVVAEPEIAKGGDGGATMHDGIGAFDMLRPLATAFRAAGPVTDDLSGGYYAARRVIEV